MVGWPANGISDLVVKIATSYSGVVVVVVVSELPSPSAGGDEAETKTVSE